MKSPFKLQVLSILLSLFIIEGFAIKTHAQKDSITWGVEPQYKGMASSFRILKTDSNFIYFYDRSLKGFKLKTLLVKHNKYTGKNTQCDIQLKTKEYNLDIVGYYYIDDTLHVFSSYYNKSTTKFFIFHETYNLDKLQSNNDINKITEIDYRELAGGTDPNQEFYDFQYSNKHYLFRYSFKTKNRQIFGLEVLDKSLHKEWSSSSKAQTESGVNYEDNYFTDNEGNVYGLQRNFENKEDVNKHYERSRLWVVCYPKGGGEPKSLALILKDDNFITSEQLSVNDKGEVICAGLYARPGTTSAIGCFSFIIEPLLTKIKSVNVQELSASIITKGQDIKTSDKVLEKLLKRKDFESDFRYYTFRIHFRTDGSFDVVAEKYKEENLKLTDNISTTHYCFDDLLVMSFNSNGSIKWIQKIPRYEYVYNTDIVGGCFFDYDKDENMIFIFNIMNAVNPTSYSNNAKTVRITLDKNGNESFKELIGDSKTAQFICPRFTFKQDENNLILIKYDYWNKNTITFGELNLK